MDGSNVLCAVSDSKNQNCQRCGNTYHATCSKLLTVLDKNEKCILVCSRCLVEVNAAEISVKNVASASGGSSGDAILERLRKMEGRFSSMEEKFNNTLEEIWASISVLEQLPSLFEKVSANKVMIAEIVKEQQNIRSLIEESRNAISLTNADDKMKQLEDAHKNLSQKFSRLNAQQAQLPQELVISGLQYNCNADLRLLSMGVLKCLYPDIQEREVLHVRSLSKKSTGVPSTSSAQSKSHPIIVTLTSPGLVRVLIQAKIKAGKVHTSSLDPNLMSTAGLVVSEGGLVNVSEFLPREVHQSRTEVRRKAKEKRFTTFVRNGQLYACWRDGEQAHIIVTEEDFNNFLILN